MRDDPVAYHKKLRGKIFVQSKVKHVGTREIRLIYTPGVAKVCRKIFSDPTQRYLLTSKANNVAIVTDGTRVLGLGSIGPDAALPVMEGKSVLYREFGKVSAFPICLNTQNKQKIIETVSNIAPAFGAINIEDIETPKVLEISDELQQRLDIPVFHDDRQGTATVALAALINALKLVKKRIDRIKVVIVGAGSAGYGITELLKFAGCKKIIVLDSTGTIYVGRTKNMSKYKHRIAKITNYKKNQDLAEALVGADVFIGVSGIKGLLKENMIKSMNRNAIVFALTNPDPEATPKVAKRGGAKIFASGSYRYKNRVNNAIVFPYLMRVILDLKIRQITPKILYATALAIANTIPKEKLTPNNIIPAVGNPKLQSAIFRRLKRV